jgi:hypothetical protein
VRARARARVCVKACIRVIIRIYVCAQGLCNLHHHLFKLTFSLHISMLLHQIANAFWQYFKNVFFGLLLLLLLLLVTKLGQ